MAEPGDEHRIVDRCRDGVAAPGQKGGRDGAAVAVQHGADARVDRIAQALHEGGIAQRPAARVRRLRGFDAAHDKTGGADPCKIHVAAEIVGARPQRRQRRQQPRLQLDETADGGRGALAHRQPHAFEFCQAARALHRSDAQDKAVGARADVAGLDEARNRHRIHRPRQHAMRDPRGLPGRHRKTRGDSGNHHGDRKYLVPPQQERRRAEHDRRDGGNRQNRLTLGGKVAGDPGAEGDGHPRQQAPGASLGADPRPQFVDERRPCCKT